jgi:hypothetical protein
VHNVLYTSGISAPVYKKQLSPVNIATHSSARITKEGFSAVPMQSGRLLILAPAAGQVSIFDPTGKQVDAFFVQAASPVSRRCFGAGIFMVRYSSFAGVTAHSVVVR